MKKPLSPRALRKRKRMAANKAMTKDARYWKNTKSADRMGYSQPVNRQAAKDLTRKPRR